jgi:flagellar protein FliS
MSYGSGYGKKGLGRYQDMKVHTASPAQIMIMLYDGAIRFSLQAKKKIEERDFEGKGVFIGKTQAIVDELMNSLDFNVSPELCGRLQQLYIYMNEKLTDANIKLNTESIDEVVNLLTTLRDAWKQALDTEGDPTAKKDEENT